MRRQGVKSDDDDDEDDDDTLFYVIGRKYLTLLSALVVSTNACKGMGACVRART